MKFGMMTLKEDHDIHSGAIPALDPNHFRRKSWHKTHLAKIRILGYDDKSIAFGKGPDSDIVSLSQTHIADMSGVR